MKKTINVTVGGLVFSIEEDGYERLSKYLEGLKNHFQNTTYGSEVIADIESRIAELFNTKTHGQVQRAITDVDVEEVLKSIGTVEDFGSAEKSTEPNSGPAKKLYRSSDDVMVAGVASGIAAYFGIDTIIVRLIFLVIILAWGSGIVLYVILWMLLPEAKTAGEKSEMKGAPATLKEFEQTAKEKIAEVKASGGLQKALNVFATILRGFIRVILAIIGVALTFATVVATVAMTFSFVNLFFNRNSPYMDFPIASVFPGVQYSLALTLIFILLAIPLIYLNLAGISLVRFKRFPINATLAIALTVVWVTALCAAGVFAIKKAPAIEAAVKDYQGAVETRTVSATDFNKIEASSAYKVNVTPGKVYSVSIEGHARDLDNSNVTVNNGALVIERKGDFKICFFCFDNSATVNVTMPNLEQIKGSGAVSYVVGEFTSPSFNVELSGASRLEISNLKTTDLELEISGASRATLAGTGKTISADLSGASRLLAYNFLVEEATLEASGASYIEINATKTLSGDVSGASKINYKGDPDIIKQDESGSSRILPD
jgi:phage shock protein PspC (stress-responsive transcriptional regulator)